MFFLIDVFFSLEVMYAFAIPFPPSSSAAPAGAGQVSLRGMGQPWVVGAGWNSHAHTTATCSGSTISWPGTMAWQTPGVGGEAFCVKGKGRSAPPEPKEKRQEEVAAHAVGTLLFPEGTTTHQVFVSCPSNRHIHLKFIQSETANLCPWRILAGQPQHQSKRERSREGGIKKQF